MVDCEHPSDNDFLLVSQFSVTGALYTCRPDSVGFVNGLPLVVIELRTPGVPARAAFEGNLTHYKQRIRALYGSTRCLLIASNVRPVVSARSRRIGSGSSRPEPDWHLAHRARGRCAADVLGSAGASRSSRKPLDLMRKWPLSLAVKPAIDGSRPREMSPETRAPPCRVSANLSGAVDRNAYHTVIRRLTSSAGYQLPPRAARVGFRT